MHYQYHIFRQLSNGAPLCVQTLPTLEEAQEHLVALAKTGSRHFAIFHAREGFVTPFPTSATKETAH
jgi:hypothetical protein